MKDFKKNFKKYLKHSSLFLVCMMLMMVNCLASENQIELVTGKDHQMGGEFVLTESQAGMLQKGDLVISIKSGDAGIYLEDVEVEVTGGLKGTVTTVDKGKQGKVTISLKRESKEATTIILKNFVITVDRMVPEGTYDLELSGSAISKGDDKLVVKDFIKIGTPNTQDIEMSSMTKGNVSFAVGVPEYIQNGKVIEMDAQTFVLGAGYIMVPARYVLQAFGVEDKNILSSNGQITIFAGGRTITLTNGSCEATINGTPYMMKAPVVIEKGRTYIPAGQIASLLGIEAHWDNDSKTASFVSE